MLSQKHLYLTLPTGSNLANKIKNKLYYDSFLNLCQVRDGYSSDFSCFLISETSSCKFTNSCNRKKWKQALVVLQSLAEKQVCVWSAYIFLRLHVMNFNFLLRLHFRFHYYHHWHILSLTVLELACVSWVVFVRHFCLWSEVQAVKYIITFVVIFMINPMTAASIKSIM